MDKTARDVMRTDLICVPVDMDLRDLTKLFLERRITGAPVVNGDHELQGVVSQTDLLYYSLTRDDELKMPSDFYHHTKFEGRHLPQGFQIEDINTGCVGDVMTPVVHTVTERASVESVARLMTREHIHRVIVRRGRRAVGIISAIDILREVGRRPGAKGSSAKTRASASAARA